MVNAAVAEYNILALNIYNLCVSFLLFFSGRWCETETWG